MRSDFPRHNLVSGERNTKKKPPRRNAAFVLWHILGISRPFFAPPGKNCNERRNRREKKERWYVSRTRDSERKRSMNAAERSCHYFRAVPESYPKGPLIKCGFHVLHFEIARPEEAPLTLAFSLEKGRLWI